MRIFTSWSGQRSHKAAQGLGSLLQDIFAETVDVFVSDHIRPGEVWMQRLGTELEQSEFGVLCLTKDNFEAPWLLFEAGAIAKKFGVARIVPYLIDELPPAWERSPLHQFEYVSADREGTYRLIENINDIRGSAKPKDRLVRSFDMAWPYLENTFKEIRASSDGPSTAQSERELLETILQRVEGLWQAQGESGESAKGLEPRDSVKNLLAEELDHLRKMRDQPTVTYKRTPVLQKELRLLRDLGLIKNKKPIADLPESFQLNQYFDITDKGKAYWQGLGPS